MKQKLIYLILFIFSQQILATQELQIQTLKQGSGELAKQGDRISVHYTGWLLDGTEFDSSIKREPFKFTIGEHRVIKGWEKGIVGMKIGEKRELIIPPHLAYGKRSVGGIIPANSILKFHVELLEIKVLAYSNISNQELEKLLNKGIPIFDIRRPEEWAQTGTIKDSIKITFFDELGNVKRDFIPKFQKIITKKDQPFIFICRTGSRTGIMAEAFAEQLGYSNFYNVKDGITHWIKKGKPVDKT